jgi:hypothetical protein
VRSHDLNDFSSAGLRQQSGQEIPGRVQFKPVKPKLSGGAYSLAERQTPSAQSARDWKSRHV